MVEYGVSGALTPVEKQLRAEETCRRKDSNTERSTSNVQNFTYKHGESTSEPRRRSEAVPETLRRKNFSQQGTSGNKAYFLLNEIVRLQKRSERDN